MRATLIPAQRNFSLALPALALVIATATALSGCGGRHIAANPPSTTGAPVESAPSVSPTSNPPGRTSPSNSGRPASRPSEVPGGFEQGLASWYGVPFNGRRSANGEIYDMYKFTAAHRTLPFDTVVRVTNLDNGMQTEVRITDRGPFVEDRIIDLSLAAARAIGMVGTGTARVKLDIISSDASNFSEPVRASGSANSTNAAPLPSSASAPSPNRPTINPASPPTVSANSAPSDRPPLAINEGYFTVQVGAFGARENAEQLKRSLESRYHPVMIQDFSGPSGHLYRVRVGNFQSEDAARGLAAKLASENGIRPMVVRQDEIAPHGDDRQ